MHYNYRIYIVLQLIIINQDAIDLQYATTTLAIGIIIKLLHISYTPNTSRSTALNVDLQQPPPELKLGIPSNTNFLSSKVLMEYLKELWKAYPK